MSSKSSSDPKRLAQIQQTADTWTLDLNVDSPSLILSSLTVNNAIVKLSGQFMQDGDWEKFSETHIIPEGFTAVSNSNINGKMKIVAQKFTDGKKTFTESVVNTIVGSPKGDIQVGDVKITPQALTVGNVTMTNQGITVGNVPTTTEGMSQRMGQTAVYGATTGRIEMTGHGVNIWSNDIVPQEISITNTEMAAENTEMPNLGTSAAASTEMPNQATNAENVSSLSASTTSSHQRKQSNWPFSMNFKWPWEWPFQ